MRAARSCAGGVGATGRSSGWRVTLLAALAALGLLMPGSPAGATPPLPDEAVRVVDQAELLSHAARERLAARLAAREAAGEGPIVVLTVERLGDRPIESFARALKDHWRLDERGAPGALVVVAWRERAVWIGEIGPAPELELDELEGVADRVILPAFHRQDFERGLEAGVAELARLLSSAGSGPAPRTGPALPGPDLARLTSGPDAAARSALAAALLMVAGCAILLARLAELPAGASPAQPDGACRVPLPGLGAGRVARG